MYGIRSADSDEQTGSQGKENEIAGDNPASGRPFRLSGCVCNGFAGEEI